MLKRKVARAARFAALAVASLLFTTTAARADLPSYVNTQSQANRLSLLHDYGISAFGGTGADIPGEPGGGILRTYMGNWASIDNTPVQRDWSISASPLVGYDTNPEARHIDQNSFFAGVDAAASYTIYLEPDNSDLRRPTRF